MILPSCLTLCLTCLPQEAELDVEEGELTGETDDTDVGFLDELKGRLQAIE